MTEDTHVAERLSMVPPEKVFASGPGNVHMKLATQEVARLAAVDLTRRNARNKLKVASQHGSSDKDVDMEGTQPGPDNTDKAVFSECLRKCPLFLLTIEQVQVYSLRRHNTTGRREGDVGDTGIMSASFWRPQRLRSSMIDSPNILY
ncbi:hypothetical protein CONLIGDRAFT_684959 [Coniochaeta ligniaria NRRL 30616]|uniref:Uncharacterized protein n=1 Tax=Coniochaeta ligniaria NRRL 30616 TaxID=1408157 RepID=A0A1J7ICC8_9PEZI|nr:hypothetical protein CONLIGDRAFT_684959 [Coniochaeta ligniaria NRRL 30616]